jgi:hypothetical protein
MIGFTVVGKNQLWPACVGSRKLSIPFDRAPPYTKRTSGHPASWLAWSFITILGIH